MWEVLTMEISDLTPHNSCPLISLLKVLSSSAEFSFVNTDRPSSNYLLFIIAVVLL